MSPTGRCSETARTGCSVANATNQRLRGRSDSPFRRRNRRTPKQAVTCADVDPRYPSGASGCHPVAAAHAIPRRTPPPSRAPWLSATGCRMGRRHGRRPLIVSRPGTRPRRTGRRSASHGTSTPTAIRRIFHSQVEVETPSGVGVAMQAFAPVAWSAPAGCGVSQSIPRCAEIRRPPARALSHRGRQVRHPQLEVQDVLRRHTRDRGRADVVHPGSAGRPRHPGGQPTGVDRPAWIRAYEQRPGPWRPRPAARCPRRVGRSRHRCAPWRPAATVTVVVQLDVAQRRAFVVGDLRRDPGPRIGSASPRRSPGDPRILGCPHADDQVERGGDASVVRIGMSLTTTASAGASRPICAALARAPVDG